MCAAGASALAVYADVVKYQTMMKCTVELITAVSETLVNLSGHLLSKGLITTEIRDQLRNQHTQTGDRAADLVDAIQKKVQLHHENYDKFVATLKQADSVYYEDILKILDETLRKLQGNCDNSFSTIECNSLTLQTSI